VFGSKLNQVNTIMGYFEGIYISDGFQGLAETRVTLLNTLNFPFAGSHFNILKFRLRVFCDPQSIPTSKHRGN